MIIRPNERAANTRVTTHFSDETRRAINEQLILMPLAEQRRLTESFWQRNNLQTIQAVRDKATEIALRLAGESKTLPGAIADIGCGDAYLVKALHQNGFTEAIGIDPIRNRRNDLDAQHFANGTHEETGLKPNSAKLLLSLAALDYSWIHVSINEMKKVMQRGAKALIVLDRPEEFRRQLAEALGLQAPEHLNGVLKMNAAEFVKTNYPLALKVVNHFETEEALKTFFEKRGFKVSELTQDNLANYLVVEKL